MRQILLCGATGHLGQHVLKQLGASGCFVRALVRTDRQAADLRGFAQDVSQGDLLQPASLSSVCDNIDTVISTVGASVHINARGKQSFREIDLAGNRNLLDAALRSGVRKFVYVSVATSPALAQTEYVKCKEEFAALVAHSGLAHHILRPTGFFSAFADLVGMARKRSLPLIGDGQARTNPIDDEEVAAACVAAIDSNDSERSIGGPDILTRKDITELVFKSIGRAPKYQRLPVTFVKAGGALAGLVNPRLRDLTEFYLAVAQNDALAPPYGKRRLADYLNTMARYS